MDAKEKELVFSALYLLLYDALYDSVGYESRAKGVLEKLSKKIPVDKTDYGNW